MLHIYLMYHLIVSLAGCRHRQPTRQAQLGGFLLHILDVLINCITPWMQLHGLLQAFNGDFLLVPSDKFLLRYVQT